MFAIRFATALQQTLAGRALGEAGAGSPAFAAPGPVDMPLAGGAPVQAAAAAAGDEWPDLAQRVREVGEW
ncbi:hypothetical protein [Acidovorax sp. BL-A-41-H1]|uniref:hypothetical protein n=1 Tax=Acidovorax sp. BL-A-41-H1 TaxID=3421102 RepID=UPI003F79BB70